MAIHNIKVTGLIDYLPGQHVVKRSMDDRQIQVLHKKDPGFFHKHKTAITIAIIATAVIGLFCLEIRRRTLEEMNRANRLNGGWDGCSWARWCNSSKEEVEPDLCGLKCPPESFNKLIKYPDNLDAPFDNLKEATKLCDSNVPIQPDDEPKFIHFCKIIGKMPDREDYMRHKTWDHRLFEKLELIRKY